jgi:hypothetical protein
MKTKTAVAAVALFFAGIAIASAQQRVTVVGCPARGVADARCLVIRGTDNVTYNITDVRQRPEIGQRAISVTGTKVNRDHFCKQGTVLANITWTYTAQSCR